VTETEQPEWGDREKRAVLWETSTALPLLHAGANILVMRHPDAIKTIENAISELNQ